MLTKSLVFYEKIHLNSTTKFVSKALSQMLPRKFKTAGAKQHIRRGGVTAPLKLKQKHHSWTQQETKFSIPFLHLALPLSQSFLSSRFSPIGSAGANPGVQLPLCGHLVFYRIAKSCNFSGFSSFLSCQEDWTKWFKISLLIKNCFCLHVFFSVPLSFPPPFLFSSNCSHF